ncbi:hypothetical protein ACO0K9_25955 [Undibacterium sp. Ji50W]|uniref:hypothetical protein n=1 Tax=Undibacterium sp. Ji50W TaxID=3413041 RepID=UPI003BF38644
MQTATELEFFARKITDSVKRRAYSELEGIMQSIFLQEHKVVLLADLSDRLASSVFEAFFLCGLPYLLGMQIEEYRKLYELSKGHDIAIYQITRFLIIHGGARKQVLVTLCSNYSEIQSVDQFKYYLEEMGDVRPNQLKFNDLIYRDYQISAENINLFKAKLSPM